MQSNLNRGLFQSDFSYQDTQSLKTSHSLKALLKEKSNWQWNAEFISLYRQGKDTWPMTVISGIQKISDPSLPAKYENVDFLNFLNFHFDHNETPSINLAISGGLDSQVLALYAKEKGIQVNAFYLESDIDNYCESNQVRAFCDSHQIECHRIKTDYEDFIASLPDFLAANECPIYNLHPVSKWILAREVSKLGIKKMYSGDGADQSFAAAPFCDLFFLTKNCFRHFEIELVTPLASWPLLSWVKQNGPFLNKEPLRQWALKKWNIGSESKKSGYFPDRNYGFDTFQQSLQHLEKSLCAP